MPRLLVNGNFATVPDAASEKGEHSYPVYIKRTGDGMLVINSFTGRVWHADGNELSKTSERAIAGRLALGPSPEELSQKAERAAAAALAQPAQIAFCPTYSCNMHCVYCYQQNNPALDKKTVSDEKLTRFLKYADSFVSESRSRRPDRAIVMQLFGGEPFSKATGPVIKKLFEFCRSRRMHAYRGNHERISLGRSFRHAAPVSRLYRPDRDYAGWGGRSP